MSRYYTRYRFAGMPGMGNTDLFDKEEARHVARFSEILPLPVAIQRLQNLRMRT